MPLSGLSIPVGPLENVVGWQVWYSDGSVHSSLDTRPQDLPPTDVQVLSIFYKRTDGKRGLWRLMMVGQDLYPIPNSKVLVRGDWTDLKTHDAITNKAAETWLDNKILL